MPDTKITALAAITTVDPAADVLPIVDISDTSMAASGTTKKITSNQILGAGGTATLASATITGDLTVDTSTLKVDSANNRVGIGTASPTQALHVRGNILTGSAAGTDSFLNVTTDGVQNSLFGFNNSGSTNASGASNNNTYIGNGNNYPVQIVSNGALVATFSSTTVRIANNNIVLATSGTGIDFSATANSSGTMTSELLNDYEEGTFTPAITGSTTAGTATYVGRSGKYTKIGNLVQVQIFIDYNSHTGTGDTRITGLPFTNAGNFSAATVGYANGLALTAGNYVQAYVDASQSFILLNQAPTGGGSNTTVPIDPAATLVITATYTV